MQEFLEPKSIEAFFGRIAEVHADDAHVPMPDEGAFLAIAEQWKSTNLRRGDLVLLRMSNGAELLHHFFGVLLAGGVPALVGTNVPATRLRELADVLNARAIASLRPLPKELGRPASSMVGNATVHQFDTTDAPTGEPGQVILLTSGTSGLSSGCLFDAHALLLNGARHAASIGQRKSDTVLINLPLHFSFALVAQALSSLVCGNRLVIGGPPFHVPTFVKTLEQYEVSVAALTPVLVRTLMQADAKIPDGVRVLSVGGDMLEKKLVEQLLSARPGKELYLTYGLTQAGPRVSTLAAHAETAHRFSSVGLPLAGTKVFLRDLGDGSERKQLFVSSSTVMHRHVGRVEGRVEHEALPAGTIATGDVFEQDDAGYLYYKSRLSDYINRGGEKICLAAARRVAAELPHVIGARTIIVRNDDGSEDFDLELRMDVAALREDGEVIEGHDLLRGLLRRADMPRKVRIVTAKEAVAHSYK